MSNDKSHLHPDLHDASPACKLEAACKMARHIAELRDNRGKSYSHLPPSFRDLEAAELAKLLEHIRRHYDLVPKPGAEEVIG